MMEINEKPSFYAVLPAHVRYEKRLKPAERLLFAEISALTNKFGYCTASNGYFADLYETRKETVSKWISHLSELGFLRLEMVYVGKQIKGRKIWIDEKVMTPIDEKVKGNNTRLNNTRINNTPLPPNTGNGKDDLNANAFVSANAKTCDQETDEPTSLETKNDSNGNGSLSGKPKDGNVPRRRKSDGVPHQEIADLYNEVLGGRLPSVQVLNDTRKRAITNRWCEMLGTVAPNGKVRFEDKETGLAWFAGFFRKVAMNQFWMGENQTGFAVNFDWIFKAGNFVKILEWHPPKTN
nr:MAG TPA: replisome organizer protein [Caudoviricetes sp.]